MSVLQEMTAQALMRGAEYPAVEWEGRWIYWDEIRRVAERVRALVEATGADPRARVAMLPRSRPGPIAALLGLIAAGRNISMIHVYQSPEGIARDIAKLKPAVVVGAAEDLPDELVSALRGQGVAAIGLTGMEAAALLGCERSTGESSPPPPRLQIELLTSGTTGPPKPFALTYDMIAEHMVGFNMMNTAGHADPASIPPVFMYLAFNTISGLYLTLPTLLPGVRGVLVKRFNLPAWRDYVVRYRPTSVGVPVPALQMILEADVPPEELSSLRFINTGTAPLDPTVQRTFEEKYGIPVLLAYGATEFGGPVTLMTMEHYQQWGSKKAGSVGPAWAGARLRVIDPETGAVQPPGREGLLEVMTPRMGDHWIRTSDMGLIDEDGFVFHRGRADGAINRGGFKLLPDEIERALKTHDAVSAAAVTGIPHHRLGQVPAAAIQLKPGVAKPSIAELEAHLRKHVAATHIPTTWRFVDTLPYNAMLKVDRVALRRLFETVEPN
jgi:acyl-coenzyme A synthetase/AMP-(fatty) acid ligase